MAPISPVPALSLLLLLLFWIKLYIIIFYDNRRPEEDQDRPKHVAWVIICWKYVIK
jgi:hypothetical protein